MDIEVQIDLSDGNRRWEKIHMLVDSGAEIDLLSEKTLHSLGMKMKPPEDVPHVYLPNSQKLDIKGYVDLVWMGKRLRRRIKTRFYIPKTETSEFEIILGCKNSIEYGLFGFALPF